MPGVTVLNLLEVIVRPVDRLEEPRFQQLMQQHHYLGALPRSAKPSGMWPPGLINGWGFEFFGCRFKVLSTGSLDRMGLSPSLRSAKVAHQ